MKVVVTGATGHLGTYVVHHLAAAGWEVVALSRSGSVPPTPFAASAKAKAVDARSLDIGTEQSTETLAAELGPDIALVHLAAFCPSNTATTQAADRRQLFETNALGTLRVLDAARMAGVRSVVYASSFEVYGIPDVADAVTEGSGTRPVTDYGATKLAGEDHAFAFAAEDRVRVVALRMPAIYGPGENTPRALPNFLKAVSSGQRPRIVGDGLDLRDQLHAADAALGVELSLTGAASGPYNLADGVPHSILELARLAMRAGGMTGEPELVASDRPRFAFHMSIAKAQRELGFQPRVELLEGMREELRWLTTLAAPSTP